MKCVGSIHLPVLVALLVMSTVGSAQEPRRPDTSFVFASSTEELIHQSAYLSAMHSWGIDLMLSTNGFGMGGFYRRQFNDDFAGMVSLGLSDVKDGGETEFITYMGTSFVPGKKNRLLMIPLVASLQYRVFRDDIVDNFRPYLAAGAGPTMMYVSPYAKRVSYTFEDGESFTSVEKIDYFESLKYGKMHYTVGGYVGGGAYFGKQRTNVLGVSVRYYFVPFPKGIEVLEGGFKKEFGGLYITLHFGSAY